MTREELLSLEPGDVVRHVNGGKAYVIYEDMGRVKIGMNVTEITNPDEWIKVDRDVGGLGVSGSFSPRPHI